MTHPNHTALIPARLLVSLVPHIQKHAPILYMPFQWPCQYFKYEHINNKISLLKPWLCRDFNILSIFKLIFNVSSLHGCALIRALACILANNEGGNCWVEKILVVIFQISLLFFSYNQFYILMSHYNLNTSKTCFRATNATKKSLKIRQSALVHIKLKPKPILSIYSNSVGA